MTSRFRFVILRSKGIPIELNCLYLYRHNINWLLKWKQYYLLWFSPLLLDERATDVQRSVMIFKSTDFQVVDAKAAPWVDVSCRALYLLWLTFSSFELFARKECHSKVILSYPKWHCSSPNSLAQKSCISLVCISSSMESRIHKSITPSLESRKRSNIRLYLPSSWWQATKQQSN